MALDAEQAAALVRVTARVSAVIVATNLLVAARRIGGGGSATALRTADLATFAAFLVSHTIHFICVALLGAATGDENIRNAGGWPLVVAAAALFYAGAAVVLRLKARPVAEWPSAGQKRLETGLLVVVWLVFFQAYALRFTQSWLFAVLAVLLLYSVARLVREALRSAGYAASPLRNP
jgi:hypothetical protein